MHLKFLMKIYPAEDQAQISAARLDFIGYARGYERELADYVCYLLDVEKRFPDLGKMLRQLKFLK